MREILFRGKSIDNAKWLEGDLLRYADTTQIWVDGEYGKSNYTVIPQTVGQYTGLTDKNGNKIFEGDIVIIETANVDEEDGNFIVEYDNGGARYVLNGETLAFDFDSIYSIEIEVIGNICDNPELLEADLNG